MADSYQQTHKGRQKGKRISWLRSIRNPRRQATSTFPLSVVAHQKESSSTPALTKQNGVPGELVIRLVHLQPRSVSGDKIRCQLKTQTLVADSYEALSYEWGPVLPELLIDLDGVDIPVRENLWWALRHLQLDDEPRILWIDAICINQTDTEERNYQVSRMDYIYHSASRCIAWVGMPEIGPDLGVEDCGPAMNFITRANLDQGKNTPPSILSEQDRRELDSLESLCRRRYWSRLWIIQEILLSKSVHIQCGPHYVLWQSLRYIFNNLKACLHVSYQFSITCSAPFRLGQAAFHRDAEPGLASPLADLTLQFKGSQCEDPRDNVFGLLGLTRHCCRDAVPTDYSMIPELLCNTLLIHHIAYHLDLEDTSPESTIAADIRDICFAVSFNSKVTQDLADSIASLSIKAMANRRARPKKSRTDLGRVILTISAIELRDALRALRTAGTPEHNRSAFTTLSHVLGAQKANDQFIDLRTTIVDKLLARSEDWILAHYPQVSHWKEQRESLANVAKTMTSRPLTHIFLTDTGYSGVTTADTKLGDTATSMGQFDLKVTFESTSPQSFHFNPVHSQPGICIDAETSFQELLSWLK